MGEHSKTLGELGENKMAYLMNLLGWEPKTENETIPCLLGDKHKENMSLRTTHGIDGLSRYECPLIENHLAFIIVSSKNQGDYSAKPSTAKKYVLDLVNTIECFKESDLRKNISRQYTYHRKYFGVLIWLSDNNDDDDFDLISKFRNEALIEAGRSGFNAIYLIDNMKANFIFHSINHIKNNDDDWNFYYHNTGYNASPRIRKPSGKVLPAEIANSGLISFKAKKEGNECLIVSIIDNYSDTVFKRLAALCQSITDSWVQKIHILFNEYNLLDELSVNKVKLAMRDDDFTRKIEVGSFKQTLRNVRV